MRSNKYNNFVALEATHVQNNRLNFWRNKPLPGTLSRPRFGYVSFTLLEASTSSLQLPASASELDHHAFSFVASPYIILRMSFDRLPALESQPTTMRRSDDPQYSDDPEFRQLTESLSNQLFTLTSNVSRLSNQISLLGTKRDTERVRERVHDLLEETRDGFKEVGEGIKRIQIWENVSVSLSAFTMLYFR